jgi:phosphoserine phosphatase
LLGYVQQLKALEGRIEELEAELKKSKEQSKWSLLMGNRVFNGAVELIQQLKERGYKIVFVTGALDFQIAPLALDLGAGVKLTSSSHEF